MVKRRLPPHIVLPNGQWRFVKRKAHAFKNRHKRYVHMKHNRRVTRIKRRVKTMARYKRVRHYGGKAIGGLKGGLPVALAGVADSVIDPRSPIDGLGSIGVGLFMKNPFAMNLGFYKAGYSAGAFIPMIGTKQQGGLL